MTTTTAFPLHFRVWFLLPAILVLLLTGSRQVYPQNTFYKTYGGPGDQVGRCTGQTNNGGYLLGGYVAAPGSADYDAYVVCTDDQGDTLWTRRWGGLGYDAVYGLVITPDNGSLFCGTHQAPGKDHNDIWLIRLNEEGDTLWTQNRFASTASVAYSIAPAPNDTYILTGTTEDAGGAAHAFLLRINAQGDTLWMKRFAWWPASGGNAVISTQDDGFMICGYIDNYAPSWNRNLAFIKTDALGDTLWTRQSGSLGNDIGWAVAELPSGGYLGAGFTTGFQAANGDAYLVKVTGNGDPEWQKVIGHSGMDVLYDIRNTSGQHLIATGFTAEEGSEVQQGWLIKLLPNGDTLWTRSFGGYGKSFGYSVMEAADQGFVIGGGTNADRADPYDAWLVKTSDSGLIVTGSSEPTETLRPVVYPNPSGGLLYINPPATTLAIRIYSFTGSLVAEWSAPTGEFIRADLSGAPVGLYLLQVTTLSGSRVYRFVIQ